MPDGSGAVVVVRGNKQALLEKEKMQLKFLLVVANRLFQGIVSRAHVAHCFDAYLIHVNILRCEAYSVMKQLIGCSIDVNVPQPTRRNYVSNRQTVRHTISRIVIRWRAVDALMSRVDSFPDLNLAFFLSSEAISIFLCLFWHFSLFRRR
jgi:hypothetical protein